MFCFWNGWSIMATADGTPSEIADVFNMIHWLQVLASSRLYSLLRRTPTREHLLRLFDVYRASVMRGAWYRRTLHREAFTAPRAAAASTLWMLLETWTPPELPAEIVVTSRELLDAEGVEQPPGGWDAFVNRSAEPLDDVLLWPEGIPVILRGQQSVDVG
jgi:hypothetical protein